MIISVFGEQKTRIDCAELEISLELEHTIIEPGFFRGEKIVHKSVVDPEGTRTYSRNERYVQFEMQEYLYKYNDCGITTLQTLLRMENKIVTFFLHQDGGLTQEMWLTNIDLFPLRNPYQNDIAVLSLSNQKFLKISQGPILDDQTGLPIFGDDGNPIIADGLIL
jgi:hypothetical protein